MKMLRDPLLHFVVLGLAVYALYAFVRPPPAQTITVTAETAAGLEADFTRQHGRAPNVEERARLLERHADERVLLAEARAHRLGEGDPIVRRRLVQLMRFVLDSGTGGESTDVELRAFWAEQPGRYQIPIRLSIEHVFFSTPDGVAQARVALEGGVDPGSLGEPFPHGRELPATTLTSLDATFGSGFGAAVANVQVGAWHGPIRSSFGDHLVRVNERLPADDAFERVRSRVVADWRAAQSEREVRARLATLRQKYEIEVVTP